MDARTFIAAAALLATTILLQSSVVAAATVAHVVGGSTGWTIPPNTSFYSDWSSSQTMAAGDTLVFNFPTGIHTVMEVPKSSFDSCSTTKQIGSTINNGPATVTVTSGTHYYICSIPGHCSAGQKLAITVTSAAVAPSVSAAPPTVNRAAPAPAPPTVNRAAPAPAPKASVPAPATAPAKAAAQTTPSPAPAAAPKVDGPTDSNPAPASAPIPSSPAPAAVPKVAGPTASSPAPIADKKSAAPPTGSVPTVPSSTANPPAAPGPSDSGNESNSSSAPRGAAGIVVALVTVVAASFLV